MAETPQSIAKREGLSGEFAAVQQLRQRRGLAVPTAVLSLPPHLRLPDPMKQLELIESFVVDLPEDDEVIARIAWNLWGDDVISQTHREDFVNLGYLERCRKALEEVSQYTDEGSVRRHVDRIALQLTVFLNSRLQHTSRSVVSVTRSPSAYKDLILRAERDAGEIWRIPKRVSVIFKGIDTVRAIAVKRFGLGSPNIAHYVEEHQSRQEQAFAALRAGTLRLREIYSRLELEQYLSSRTHGPDVVLDNVELSQTVTSWLSALREFDCYDVAITEDPVPFKYQIVDGSMMIIHEAIGKADSFRLNAIAIQSPEVVKEFVEDFELIWERTSPTMRDKATVISLVAELAQENGVRL